VVAVSFVVLFDAQSLMPRGASKNFAQ
jgi:hypothetical protein